MVTFFNKSVLSSDFPYNYALCLRPIRHFATGTVGNFVIKKSQASVLYDVFCLGKHLHSFFKHMSHDMRKPTK